MVDRGICPTESVLRIIYMFAWYIFVLSIYEILSFDDTFSQFLKKSNNDDDDKMKKKKKNEDKRWLYLVLRFHSLTQLFGLYVLVLVLAPVRCSTLYTVVLMVIR